MASHDSFTETQIQLTGAKCPGCEGADLELRLFCERGGACTHHAICQGCGITFAVHTGSAPEMVKRLLPDLSCRECGSRKAGYRMVCELSSRSCDPGVVCLDCGHPFASPLAGGVESSRRSPIPRPA